MKSFILMENYNQFEELSDLMEICIKRVYIPIISNHDLYQQSLLYLNIQIRIILCFFQIGFQCFFDKLL